MDKRTERLMDDWRRLRQGGPSNSIKDIAEGWLAELRAEQAQWDEFAARADTLLLRCLDPNPSE